MGIFLPHVREQIGVIVDCQTGMVPALKQHLDSSGSGEFIQLLIHLLMGDDIAVGLFLRAVEGTELAVDIADVRVVDVPVDDIGDDLIPLPVKSIGSCQHPAMIGQGPKLLQRQTVEFQRLLGGDARALDHAVGQGFWAQGSHRGHGSRG